MTARFSDRAEAGRMLGDRLGGYRDHNDVLVLGLPRGGVPVAYEVARALRAPLDVFVVRKLGVPGHQELAMGAIASGGVRVFNKEVIDALGIPMSEIEHVAQREQKELERRERIYRGDRAGTDPTGRTVILVDDGLATGSTMRAAIAAVRRKYPARIVVAVPTGADDVCEMIGAMADETVCLLIPERFEAVGNWYENFSQVSDQEVQRLLQAAAAHAAEHPGHPEALHHETQHSPRHH